MSVSYTHLDVYKRQFVGKLAFFRVYSGTCKSGSYVLNATKNKKERVGRILQMHANKREELDVERPPDINSKDNLRYGRRKIDHSFRHSGDSKRNAK